MDKENNIMDIEIDREEDSNKKKSKNKRQKVFIL